MHYITHTTQEEETFLRFAGGDEAALARMYNQLYKPLVRYGCRIVSDEFEVSVMAQEAFLRLWEFRTRITSMFHAWCFLRLVLRWKCYAWHRRRKTGLRIVYSEHIEELAVADGVNPLLYEQQYEEKRRLVLQVLPYLAPKKQTVMKLYFHYGFGCRQIARHMGRTGSTTVRRELESSLAHLKAVLRLIKKAAGAPVKKAGALLGTAGGLTSEQEAVFRLRYEDKKGFTEIAGRLGLPRQQVEQQYIRAWNLIRQQKTGTQKATVQHG